MRRTAITVIVLLHLLALPAAVSAAPDNDTGNVTANNSTVEQLRERLHEKNQTVQNLRSKRSQLKTKVTNLQGRIQNLEYQLNSSGSSGSFPSWMATQMKRNGAWNPYNNEPAWYIIRNDEIWYFVGEKNGDHSPNGMRAWATWFTFEEAGGYSEEAPYSPDAVNGTLTFQTGFQATGAKAAIRSKVSRLNTPRTFGAYQEWNNRQRNQAETTGRNTWIGIGSLFLVGIYGAMWVESKRKLIQDRQERKEIARQMGFMGVRRESNWKTRVLGALLGPPVIGHVTAALLRAYDSVSGDGGGHRR
jgi:hypothetical protein